MNQPFEMNLTALWARMLRLTAIVALTVAGAAHARLSVFEALDCCRRPKIDSLKGIVPIQN